MSMLVKFADVVEKLKNTNSATEKVEILSQYKNDEEVCKFFKYAYNSFYMYGISSKNLKKNNNLSELEFFKDLFELLDQLRTNQITGNKAIAIVNGYINQNYQFEDLLYDFFDRNLKIGMGITQINKALNNIIPVFDVALAATFDPDKEQKYHLENYRIQRKCNGLRLVTIITCENGNVEIKNYSRKGKEFTTCKKINDELMDVYKNSKYFGQNIVFDGEVCIIDENDKEDWNRAVSEAKRKDYTMNNPRYTIFDFLTLNQFTGLEQSPVYDVRIHNLTYNFFGFKQKKFQHLNIVFSVPYTKERFDRLCKEYVITDKWEGLIYRKNTIYKAGRSTDLIKFKLFRDAEYRVLDVQYTEKQMLVDGIMKQIKCVGALKIMHKNNEVYVGSGLSDQQRLDWYKNPSEIIGKQIQVKYKEETKNQDGTISLQFPVLLHVFEEDRDF